MSKAGEDTNNGAASTKSVSDAGEDSDKGNASTKRPRQYTKADRESNTAEDCILEQADNDLFVSCASVIKEKGEHDVTDALRFPVGTVCYPVRDSAVQTSWTTTTYSRTKVKCGLKLYQ